MKALLVRPFPRDGSRPANLYLNAYHLNRWYLIKQKTALFPVNDTPFANIIYGISSHHAPGPSSVYPLYLIKLYFFGQFTFVQLKLLVKLRATAQTPRRSTFNPCSKDVFFLQQNHHNSPPPNDITTLIYSCNAQCSQMPYIACDIF